ncbi:MAG TPA: lipopolysaccharide kinase InaA family protein [Desulfomonilaceae bacterium]|nr:lipopolysaccharide kinase InaA family protein [Desulfomonilaceae bacterium]
MDDDVSLKIHPHAGSILQSREKDLSEFFFSCIREHGRILSAGDGLILKNAPESAVTIVTLADSRPVCVKEFRWRGWAHAMKGLFRPTQGARTFRNGWRLRNQGIGASAPLALASRKKCGLTESEWVIMEVIPEALEMDRYLTKKMTTPWSSEEKRGVARMFGRFMGSLHATGIFHSDLKTCNILVSEDHRISGGNDPHPRNSGDSGYQAVRFFLLDYDDVRFCRDVSRKHRVKNLIQLFLSVPVSIGAVQRLRFLSEYALHSGIGMKQRRALAVEVLDACRGKHILYVGLSGDVREKWD